jgi:hypothetical protein
MDYDTAVNLIGVLVIVITTIITIIILIILVILFPKPLDPMPQNISQNVQRVLPRRDLLVGNIRRPHARLLKIREVLEECLESVCWMVHVVLGPHWVHDDQSLVRRVFIVLEREANRVVMVRTAAEDRFLTVAGFAVGATVEEGCLQPGHVHHWHSWYHDGDRLWDGDEWYEREHGFGEWSKSMDCSGGRCGLCWVVDDGCL